MADTETSTQQLIATAVEPLRKQAVKRAVEAGKGQVERVRKALEEAGGDLQKAAPYPEYRDASYLFKTGERMLFQSLVEDDPVHRRTYGIKDSHFVLMSEKKIKRFMENVKRDANSQFDAFVRKLTKKVGDDITSAEIDGNYVWDGSILTVKRSDDSTERWRTTMIVNVSKYGKMFNQFPTRKLKN